MARIRVLIAEDEPTVREALEDLLSSDGALELVGAARDAEEAIELAVARRPDVVLVDVKMPAGGGPRATREIRARVPGAKVVALSAYEDRSTVLEMLRCGASGYLVKGIAPEEILESLRGSVSGGARLSANVAPLVIDELTTLLEQSERLAGELHALDRLRGEMIQNLSHELLTPTTVIQGTGRTLAKHAERLSGEELKALTTGVAQATERLQRLVGNVSLAAKLDRGEGDLALQPVRAGELLASAIDESQARDRLRVVSSCDPVLLADPALAARALCALIENALDLSDGPIEIYVEAADEGVSFAVLDRGPGIPEDVAERIFDPFVQGDGSSTRAHEGLGIGLYLARRIAESHGGSISASARPDGGSAFTLVLPVLSCEGDR